MAYRADVRSSCHSNNHNATKKEHCSSALPHENKQNTSSSLQCEAVRVRVQRNLLERKQKVLIGSLKTLESHLVKDLSDLNEELNNKRLKEAEELKKDVIAVVHLLKEIKRNAVIENVKEIDIEYFKVNLLELERKIAAIQRVFEKQSSLLYCQEQELNEHLASVEKKIDEWAKPLKIDTVLPIDHHNFPSGGGSYSYNECVNNFQMFLRDRGGHTGGWDESDHLIFTRLLKKHQNKQTLYTHLKHEFPDKTVEAFCEHYQWYSEYEDLKAKQKQAIAEWRVSKNKSQCKTASCSEQLPVRGMFEDLQKTNLTEYREQKKQQLEKWKNIKEQDLEMKALKRKEEEERRVIQEEAKKLRHAIQKAELERYKEEKLKKELAIALEKETLRNIQAEERAWNANKIIKAFRQRDAVALARQKEMKSHSEKQRYAKEKALEALRQKIRVEVARDPHRLLRPTGAWRERTKVEKCLEPVSSRSPLLLNVQEVPHLGIPLWRRNQK